jgi:hypothetical protein
MFVFSFYYSSLKSNEKKHIPPPEMFHISNRIQRGNYIFKTHIYIYTIHVSALVQALH